MSRMKGTGRLAQGHEAKKGQTGEVEQVLATDMRQTGEAEPVLATVMEQTDESVQYRETDLEQTSESGQVREAKKGGTGVLTVVATPIGNLEDITFRALRLLREADLIAAEDTRQTLRLLNHFEIRKPLISCHDMNERSRTAGLLDKLREGQNVVLVSDAGTPGISDPGEILVREAIAAGIPVTMAPGCAAVVMAVVLSGLPTGRFAFEGFLPQQGRERRRMLESLCHETRTLVFYESPHRVVDMLEDVRAIFGDRRCALARELTKKFEEVVRGDVTSVLAHYTAQEPRGEFVVVIAGADAKEAEMAIRAAQTWQELSVEEHVEQVMSEGLSRMEAMKRVAKARGVSKRDIYAALNVETSGEQ